MKAKDKQLMFLLCVLIAIVIIAIFILFGSVTQKENDNKYTDTKILETEKIKGKYETNTINGEYKRLDNEGIKLLDNTIDYVINNINSKNYTELYKMVPEWHKKIKFNTIEEFRKYIEKIFTLNDYECLSYRLDGGNVYIKLTADAEDVFELKVRGFKAEKNAYILFENIDDVLETPVRFGTSKMIFDMMAIVEYDEDLSVFFEITNENNKEKKILIENLKLITILNGAEESIDSQKLYEYIIGVGETLRVEMNFEINEKIVYPPNFIEFDFTIDGEKMHIKQVMQYDDEAIYG